MKQFYNKQKWLKKTIAMVIVCLCGTALTAVAQTISGDCSGAQQITVGNCTSNQNVSNTTVNDPTVSGCNTSAARDGWFYFVAGTTRSTVYFNNNSSRNAAIHVYTGTCASLTQVACMNDNGGGSDETVTFNTTAGTTYRVRIVHTSGTTSTLNGSVCVYNAPAILSFSPSPICTGATVTITGTSFTGTTAVSINGTAASSFTVVNSTTITAVVAAATTSGVISVTSPNGTSTSASSLTVNTTPVATSTPASRTLCESGNANLALTSNVGATSFTWTVVQTNVSGASDCAASCGTNISQTVSNVNGTSAGTAVYTITPATATCTGNPINVTVTANPKPVGTPSDATPDICGPAGPAVSLSSSLGGTSYTWTVSQSGVTGGSNCSSGCGSSINQTLTASGVTPGTAIYTVTPTASSCAGNTFTVAVTVKPKPVASATPTTQTLCSPAAASIGLSSTVSGSTFAWTAFQSGVTGATAGSGSSIAQTISTTGAGQGTATYTVTPTADGCNGNTITTSVVVNPPPSVSLSSSAADICIGSSATLTATSSGGTLGSISGSNTTSGSIPDNSVTGLSRTITLPAGIMTAATNLTVTLNIAHTWVGDLIVTLTGPCGTTIIFDRPGVPASTIDRCNAVRRAARRAVATLA
ncbi:MAG TPA: hypothetical protein PLU53_08255, partial [Bacteroidia bacterium]|nr:hypothetical protein [Bacteroidia bacterium]